VASNKFMAAYEYQNLRFSPQIYRPVDEEGRELIEDIDCLGSTLGIAFV